MVPLIDIPAVPTELEQTTVDMVEGDDDQWAAYRLMAGISHQ